MEGIKMKVKIEELKKQIPNTLSMEEYVKSLEKNEPTIIFRDYSAPTTPPCLETGVKTFNFKENPRPTDDIMNAFGTKPNVPGINVVNAIKAALGPGGYSLHISDGSYTGYSIWELQEFMKNFDSTNLRVWIPETFDCDDFAEVLQGNTNGFFPGISFGTLWYGDKAGTWGHAVNIFYDYVGNKAWLVEPQNDIFYEFRKDLWVPWVVMI
jgi:hypothetical protein